MEKVYYERKIDKLGRVVLPVEIRKHFQLNPEESVRFFIEEDKVILTQSDLHCCFCGDKYNLIKFRNNYICKTCLKELERKKFESKLIWIMHLIKRLQYRITCSLGVFIHHNSNFAPLKS